MLQKSSQRVWGRFWGSRGQDAYRKGQLWCRTECCVTVEGDLVLFQESRENISLHIDNTTKLCCTSVLWRLIVNGSLVKSIAGSSQQLDLQAAYASFLWLPIDYLLSFEAQK